MKNMLGRSWAGGLMVALAISGGCGLTHDRRDEIAERDDCRTDRVQVVTDLAAKTSLGFSADSVLSFVEGTHSSELQWFLPVDASDLRFAFDELTLDIERSGAVRLVKTKEKPGDRACPLALEIDATVRLTSKNGLLDESFQSVIVAREAKLAELHHEFSPEDAFGEIASRRLASAGTVLTQLELSAELAPSRVSGSISGEFETDTPDAEEAPAVELAVWPPRDFCEGSEPQDEGVLRIPLRSDSTEADAPLAHLNGAGPMRLVWSNGDATNLDLHAAQVGVGCMQRPEGGVPIFTYPMKLDAASQDGRLKAQLEGTLWVTSAITAPADKPTVAVLQTRIDAHSAAELEAKTGIAGVDWNGYESIILRCSVYYAPEEGQPQGMLLLFGESGGGNGLTEILTGIFQQ